MLVVSIVSRRILGKGSLSLLVIDVVGRLIYCEVVKSSVMSGVIKPTVFLSRLPKFITPMVSGGNKDKSSL